MKCLQCRFDNPDSMRFCVDCGAPLVLSCPTCATEMRLTYKFCGQCGESLAGVAAPESGVSGPVVAAHQRGAVIPKPAPRTGLGGNQDQPTVTESERKHVTVVACELTMAESASTPDTLHELLTLFFELAREEIERYGGVLNRVAGRGFMALFGAPIAYEDHPHRALLACRDLRRRLSREDASRLLSATPKMGVDTGSVVVGGGGELAVGEATEVAVKLQESAQPGEILLSENTARLVQGGQLGLVAAEISSEILELPAWTLPEAAPTHHQSPFSAKTASPLIGRERDLALLEELRDKARHGRGQVVAVSGEAGSGKSRLLHELYIRTFPSQSHDSYLRGQCVSYGVGIPYLPLIDMIRKASRILESDDHATIRQKLEASLSGVGTDVEETLPFLLRLLGVKAGSESLDELEPQAIQTRTFAAMRRMLLDASRRALVVIEIEDLQWIDATSAEFLDSLIDAMPAARLLVLLTYRAGYQPRWLDKSYAAQLNIGRLSDTESRQLVATLLERAELPEDFSSEILNKAEGNPFFLEQMAQALVDGASADSVPDTVQGMLMARIDRLPEDHKQLLRAASTLGRELAIELLEEIWDRPAELTPLLDDLQSWELLYKAPTEDHVTYFFQQALTQEVVYQSLLASQLRKLHLKAAVALERLYADRIEDAIDRLVYHYPKAGEPQKTVHYLTLFAHQAAQGYAHQEAAQALRQALPQVEKLPEEGRETRLMEVLLQLAESLLPLAQFPETLELFTTHLERLEALDKPELAGPYYFWLAHTYTYLGLQEETWEYAEKSIEASRQAEDEATEGKARYVLGRDGFWAGKFQKGIENSLRAVALLERNGEAWWQGQAYWVAGFNHYALGQFEQAVDTLERAHALGEALDDYRLDTSWSLGYFYASLGEAEVGIRQCQEGLANSHDPLNSAVSTGFLGHAQLQAGQIGEAVENLERSSSLMANAGMQQLEGWFLAILGEALLASGQFEQAEEVARKGLEASQESRFWYGVGLAQSALGRIALGAGKLDAARPLLEKAREQFEELLVPFEVARLNLDLAKLARETDQGAEATRLFQETRRQFQELQVPFWLEKATSAAESAR